MGCFRIFIFLAAIEAFLWHPSTISIELFTLKRFLQIPIPLAEGENLYWSKHLNPCDLRSTSLCKNHPLSCFLSQEGAWSENSSRAQWLEWPIVRTSGQMIQLSHGAAGMDPSILGLPGPLRPGKGLWCHTQGDHFSGWGQVERPLGERHPIVWVAFYQGHFLKLERGAPTVSGDRLVLARTHSPLPLRVGELG